MSSLSCSHFSRIWPPGNKDPLDAVIAGLDNDAGTVDATGSVGDEVRVVIKRNGVVIETTPAESNNGNNQISITGPLENGDTVCVQTSNDGFILLDEDCHTIPTPLFGFVPVS
ncbi:hypothetical protein [Phaeodactylibacter xiamenensis]|uniref:hypothetical protein n=1 Tax=Phaeodactylibacter xiamenensis TaxID=1524460 RepID=UPI0024A984D3|nr:hypothetical protein [Phaeodactylibacter xiamenensis]